MLKEVSKWAAVRVLNSSCCMVLSEGWTNLKVCPQITGFNMTLLFWQSLRTASSPGSSPNPNRRAPLWANMSSCPVPSPESLSPSTPGPGPTWAHHWRLEETMSCCRERTWSHCSSGLNNLLFVYLNWFWSWTNEDLMLTYCVSQEGSEASYWRLPDQPEVREPLPVLCLYRT